jgi:hypothetical protein
VLDLRTGGALPTAKRSITVTGSATCCEWAVSGGGLGQPLEELLDGDGHGETGGSDADTGPAAVADDRHAGFGHAFQEVTGEVAVAGVPDPLTVRLAEGGPPLVGEWPEVSRRGTTSVSSR